MKIKIDDQIRVVHLARALAEAGLALRYRQGEIVLEQVKARPMPVDRDIPMLLRRQAG